QLCEPGLIVRSEQAADDARRVDDLAAPVVGAVALDREWDLRLAQRAQVDVPVPAAAEEHTEAAPRDAVRVVQLAQVARERARLVRRRLGGTRRARRTALARRGQPELDGCAATGGKPARRLALLAPRERLQRPLQGR